MSPKMPKLDTSKAQADQATTSDQVHAPSEAVCSPGENDSIIARENSEKGDTLLQVLCRAVLAGEPKEELTSSYSLPHHFNLTGSVAFASQVAPFEFVRLPWIFSNVTTSSHSTTGLEMVVRRPMRSLKATAPFKSPSSEVVAWRIRKPANAHNPVTEDQGQPCSSSSPLKRQREEEDLDFVSRDGESKCSFCDNRHSSKKPKADCSCDFGRIWWMTQKAGDVNKMVKRMDDIIDHTEGMDDILLGIISNKSNDLSQKVREILEIYRQGLDVDALYESKKFLEDLRDDMIQEGGIDEMIW